MKRGGAKPQRTLTATNRRTRSMSFAVSWDDEREIKRRARRADKTIAAFVRECVLGDRHGAPCLDDDCPGTLMIREDGVYCITCLRKYHERVT